MTDCDVCYCPIENKVKLECSHEFCLKCIVNILKIKYDVLTCPMCRKKYKDIYINKEIFEEMPFEVPFDGPGYDISIVKQETGLIKQLLTDLHPNSQCDFYEVNIRNSFENIEATVSFYILYEIQIEDSMIEYMIFDLITDNLPLDNIIPKLRQGIVNVGQFKMTNNHLYLQDFYDIVIEKIEHV